MDEVECLIFEDCASIFTEILDEFFYPNWFISFILHIQNFTERSLMTFETFCLMDIFWSPSFYTIMLTKLLSCCVLVEIHSIQFYSILKVRLTILGLVSFSILSSVGKTAFIEDSNSGLFLLIWILYSKSYIA